MCRFRRGCYDINCIQRCRLWEVRYRRTRRSMAAWWRGICSELKANSHPTIHTVMGKQYSCRWTLQLCIAAMSNYCRLLVSNARDVWGFKLKCYLSFGLWCSFRSCRRIALRSGASRGGKGKDGYGHTLEIYTDNATRPVDIPFLLTRPLAIAL